MDWLLGEGERGVRMSQGARIMPFTEAERTRRKRLHKDIRVPTLHLVGSPYGISTCPVALAMSSDRAPR